MPLFHPADGCRDEMLRGQTVCFTGHRILAANDRQLLAGSLDRVLEKCYENGCRRFFCGAAMGFDMLAAERVNLLQTRHPEVSLILAIPCRDQDVRWTAPDRLRYSRLLYTSTEIRLLAERYYNGCMQVRNRHMVDRSSLCIAFMKAAQGGTASTVRYAAAQDIRVLNLAVPASVTNFLYEE